MLARCDFLRGSAVNSVQALAEEQFKDSESERRLNDEGQRSFAVPYPLKEFPACLKTGEESKRLVDWKKELSRVKYWMRQTVRENS